MTDLTTAAIKTVEWALRNQRYCYACRKYLPHRAYEGDACPIPALGAAILREQHWMTREWARAGRELAGDPCWMTLAWGWTAYPAEGPRLCLRPRGHDNNAHEPTPEELA
jgi:hypothetical protein